MTELTSSSSSKALLRIFQNLVWALSRTQCICARFFYCFYQGVIKLGQVVLMNLNATEHQ